MSLTGNLMALCKKDITPLLVCTGVTSFLHQPIELMFKSNDINDISNGSQIHQFRNCLLIRRQEHTNVHRFRLCFFFKTFHRSFLFACFCHIAVCYFTGWLFSTVFINVIFHLPFSIQDKLLSFKTTGADWGTRWWRHYSMAVKVSCNWSLTEIWIKW